MWENLGYHKNKIFAIILIVGIIVSMWVPEEELEDPYIITVDYDCREIIRDPSDIPSDIVIQCRNLIIELETKNAPEQSKRGTPA
jgi:hypothetical protein